MSQVPIAREPIHARILAHGGDGDAIAQTYFPQNETIKQVRHFQPLSIVTSEKRLALFSLHQMRIPLSGMLGKP
jgi:hypothetical protein